VTPRYSAGILQRNSPDQGYQKILFSSTIQLTFGIYRKYLTIN
jgi:hypothetical protein